MLIFCFFFFGFCKFGYGYPIGYPVLTGTGTGTGNYILYPHLYPTRPDYIRVRVQGYPYPT